MERHGKAARREAGMSLLEALIAVAVMVAVLAGVAQLLIWSRRTAWSSGTASIAATLASQKLRQLRALTWAFDRDGRPIEDDRTDVSTDPASLGGTGLRTSPPDSLQRNTHGFVDYLDGAGAWTGNGDAPPAGSVFVRRWAIERFVDDPDNTLVLHALVVPLSDVAAGDPAASPRAAHLATIVTRGLP